MDDFGGVEFTQVFHLTLLVLMKEFTRTYFDVDSRVDVDLSEIVQSGQVGSQISGVQSQIGIRWDSSMRIQISTILSLAEKGVCPDVCPGERLKVCFNRSYCNFRHHCGSSSKHISCVMADVNER